MSNDAKEDRIRQVILDFESGKLDKYEAMDALDLDHVWELLEVQAKYGGGPELTRDYFQSDPSAPPAKDYFTEGG